MTREREKELKNQIKEKILEEMLLVSEKMIEAEDDVDWINFHHQYQRYQKMLSDLENPKWKIDPNTLLIVGGNLLGILMILNFERAGIVTSRAIQFVLKSKI